MEKVLANKFTRYLLCLFGGFLYACGFPLWGTDFSIFFAPIIGYALFYFCFWRATSNWQFLLLPLAFSLGFYLTGFYWIPFTIQEFGFIPAPLNYILGILFSLILLPQLLFYALIWIVFKKFHHLKEWNSPLIQAIIITLLEYFIPQQFPAHPGHAWFPLQPYLSLAPIMGVVFYSFISHWMSTSLASLFSQNKLIAKFLIAPLTLIILTLFWGLLFKLEKNEGSKLANLRIVQANIGNNLKLSSERGSENSVYKVFDKYRSLSIEGPEMLALDLIIWPETAYPLLLDSKMMKEQGKMGLPQVVREVIDATGANLLFGGYDKAETDSFFFEGEFNTAFLAGHDSKLRERYHKMKLIPFGEGLPFGPFNKLLSNFITNISYFAKGDEYTIFNLKEDLNFSTVICYEILFPEFLRTFFNNAKTRPDFLVNLTNDSWYGDTSEPKQHLFLAKWRALEFNIPVVRSTNTGITSIIYPDGSESERLKTNEESSLDVQLKLNASHSTIFQKVGIIPLILLWLVLIGVMIFLGKRNIYLI